MPAMAYSPIEQGRLPASGVLATLASEHGVCAPQIALAWLLRRKDLLVIPKASSIEHLRQNHQALAITLAPEDLRAIDRESRRLAARPRWKCFDHASIQPRDLTKDEGWLIVGGWEESRLDRRLLRIRARSFTAGQ